MHVFSLFIKGLPYITSFSDIKIKSIFSNSINVAIGIWAQVSQPQRGILTTKLQTTYI